MLTSILIYFIILLSITMIFSSAVFARRRPSLALNISIGYIIALLFCFGVIALNLPLRINGITWSVGRLDFGWPLVVDQVSWRLSLLLLVLTLAVLISYKRQSRFVTESVEEDRFHCAATPIQMLLIFFSLIAVWSDSLFGLANSIVGFILCWYIFLFSIGHPRTALRDLLLLLLGVGLLGVVTVYQPVTSMAFSQTMEWNLTTAILTFLTGFIFIVAIPIQLWRSIDKLPVWSISLSTILPLAPATIGCLIIARISIYRFESSTYPILFTVIGLICLLAGISLAWLHIKTFGRLLSALIIAESGMVLIVAVWTTQMATVAQSGILILAIGAIVLLTQEQRRKFNWPKIIPTLAVAGLPLTVGFRGMQTLYGSWLEGGGLTLFMVTVFLHIPLITLLLHIYKRAKAVDRTEKPDRYLRGLEVGISILLALALVRIPSDFSFRMAILPLIGIVFSIAGALLLSTFVTGRYFSGDEFRNAFRIRTQFDHINELVRRISSDLYQFICEISRIVEGEGGMLWVLIIIVVLWLART